MAQTQEFVMLDHARDCLAARNLSGLLATAQNLPPIGILALIDSALCSKKEWAWPHLVRLVEAPCHTSVLCLASANGHKQCFDAVFSSLDWTTISEKIVHDLITRCATHNDTHGFLKTAPFVPMRTCSHIAAIAVQRNNPEILAHILSHTVLSIDEQRRTVVLAVEMQHETCLDTLLPYITKVSFDDADIRNMMHHVGAPADLLKKVAPYFTQHNFNTVLHLACMDGNEDVLEFAFPHTNVSNVLKNFNGRPPTILQERIDRAQNNRILQKIKIKPSPASVRKI